MKKILNYKDNKYYQEKISEYKKDNIAEAFAIWSILFMLCLACYFCWMKSSNSVTESIIAAGSILFIVTLWLIIHVLIENHCNYEVLELNVVDKKMTNGAAAGTESYKVKDESGKWYFVDNESIYQDISENNFSFCICYKNKIVSFLDRDKYLCST